MVEMNLLEESFQKPLHTLSVSEVFSLLDTTSLGIGQAEAEKRLETHGRNALKEIKGKPIIFKLLANFTHMMAILLWVAGIAALFARMPQLAIAVWMVNIINGAFSFWQEFRAEKATDALKQMLPSYARVLREGIEQRMLAEELVPGDIVLLAEGDRISADCRLIDDSELQIDQSTLTGESNPVRKTSSAVLRTDLTPAEVTNLVFAGTNVASGTAKAVVFKTGMNTEFGKIASLTQTLEEEPSPLQKEMVVATRMVTYVAVVVGVLFFLLSVIFVGMTLAESFIFAIGMIVAFVPEGMLPTVTLSLAMGVQRMAKRNALIKRLSAVETLGCTTVICTDKTGTLTQNEMTVNDLWQGGRQIRVTGTGYAPEGQTLKGDAVITANTDGDLRQLLTVAALCNNARLLPPDGESNRWTILGDPTEAALLVAANKGGIDPDSVSRQIVRLRELPFESRRKRMSTIHRLPAVGGVSDTVAFIKGAPKEVLDLCTSLTRDGRIEAMSDNLVAQIMAANDEYARNGLRVLAFAHKTLPPSDGPQMKLSEHTVESIESDLTFLGLIAMMDPPRPEVLDAVTRCHHAGIRIIMITGDYGLTAESIARRIGIVRGEHPRVVTGVQLDTMDEAALEDALKDEVLFARVAPEHKLRVVSALQVLGEVVAVTGDGVNDAPALKKADIGVAMGITGTDVAKEAAAMILTDDNFASIVNAVEEGRAVYANIKKFCTYIFTSNAPEAVPFIVFAFTAGRIPLALTVMHVLAVDLGTDLVPALALGAEEPEPGIMDQPPRSLKDHVITKKMLTRAYVILGPVQGLATMAAFYYMYWTNGYAGQWIDLPGEGWLYQAATAMALSAVVITQVGNLFAQRTEKTSIFKVGLPKHKLFWIGIASELILVLLMVYAPFMQRFIGTSQFPARNWLFLLLWTPALLIVDEIRKAFVRWQDRRIRASAEKA